MRILAIFLDWLKNPIDVAPEWQLSRLLASFDYAIVSYLDDILILSYEDESRTAELLALL